MLRHRQKECCVQTEQEAAERRDEEAYREQLMARFAEEDKVEQMNAQRVGCASSSTSGRLPGSSARSKL